MFRRERTWRQFHNPIDLAISINLEAVELLEPFQWSGGGVELTDKLPAVDQELVVISVYCICFAD